MVPRHVQEDVKWMAEHAVDGVFVGVHDADLCGGNTAMVCDIIRSAGMDVWLIPSRLGGLMAGWGRQPSYLSANNPEWWARNADGAVRQSFGPQVSVFQPDVPEAVAETVGKMLEQFPATGIVWDEIKTLSGEDHSHWAVEALGRPAKEQDMIEGTVACFSKINRQLKKMQPDLRISAFLYADSSDEHVARCAAIELLDEFGCDGKCYPPGVSVAGEGGGNKVLLGGHDARFAAAAQAHNLTPFTLLETQLLDTPEMELSLQHLPGFLQQKTGHLVYYYYPYGMGDPERFMSELGKALAAWRRQ